MGEVYNLNDTSEGKALKAPSVPIFTHDLVNFEVSAQERIRLATDGARYKANGLLPADFQIAGLTDSKPQSKKHSGYKQQRHKEFGKPAARAETTPASQESQISEATQNEILSNASQVFVKAFCEQEQKGLTQMGSEMSKAIGKVGNGLYDTATFPNRIAEFCMATIFDAPKALKMGENAGTAVGKSLAVASMPLTHPISICRS